MYVIINGFKSIKGLSLFMLLFNFELI
jgi:hypothetical protein